MGAAILVDVLAFVIWNLAPRSPARVLRDIVTAPRRPLVLVRGTVSFIVGLLLLLGSVTLLRPLPLSDRVLDVLTIWAMVTGLVVEQLIGPLRGNNLRPE